MSTPTIEGFDVEGLDPTFVQAAADSSEYTRAVGMVIDRVTPDRLEAHVDCGPQHHQPYGLVHGGVWCSVVEGLGSFAGGVNAGGAQVVGVSNTTDFVRPHREGRVDAVATPIHRGRTQQLWEVRITRHDDGKLVARGQLRLQVLPGTDGRVEGRSA